jgi:NADPH-dependent 2,4-dienoyl-CoA reductase/sulfur reductase-like enzyme
VTDVLVIGAGPAGLAAAAGAAEEGLDVLLLDEQPAAGGQVWRNAAARLAGAPGPDDGDAGAAAALAALDHPRVAHVAGATVVDAQRDGRVAWLAPPGETPRMRETQAAAIVVASGAMERPLVFPGAALPGVMGVGALQLLLKQGVVPQGRIVLAGQGPLPLLTLAQLRRAGAEVTAMLDVGPALPRVLPSGLPDAALFSKGLGLLARRALSGVAIHRGVRRLRAEGDGALAQARFVVGGRERVLPCALLAVHDGVIANTQATRLMGLRHRWRDAEAAFAPETDEAGRAGGVVWIAGDAAGIDGAEAARVSGALAGVDAARALGALAPEAAGARIRALQADLRRIRRGRRFLDALYPPLPVDALATDDALLCRCEAVTVGEVRAAVADGAAGPNRVKAYTRCGMGPCQGRMCGNALTRMVSILNGRPPDAVGALRIRPPLKPVLVEDYLDADALAAATP